LPEVHCERFLEMPEQRLLQNLHQRRFSTATNHVERFPNSFSCSIRFGTHETVFFWDLVKDLRKKKETLKINFRSLP